MNPFSATVICRILQTECGPDFWGAGDRSSAELAAAGLRFQF
jgi:hypothetical protein